MRKLLVYQKRFIELLIQQGALQFGNYALKSGHISPYFFNLNKIRTGLALATVGKCYAAAIQHAKVDCDGLFGPAYKGIPLACTTAMELARRFQRDILYSFNRKGKKNHGEGVDILGAPLEGRIVILDDVITTGTVVREAIHCVQASHAEVTGIVIALDRQEKGDTQLSSVKELNEFLGIPVVSIIQLQDIISYLEEQPSYSTLIAHLKRYQEQYCV